MSAPQWLIEVLRPHPIAPPWLRMVRAPLAVGVPLAVAFALGHVMLGLPAALGGLVSTVVDRGGAYLGRLKRVGGAVFLGAASGLAIGVAIHGAGWIAVVVIAILALVSAMLSAAGSIGSVAGLQFLLYSVLGSGQLALVGPGWLVVGLFLAGGCWSLGLLLLEWVLFAQRPEQRSVADAYRAIAAMLRAIGTPHFEQARQGATTALDAAYDQVLTSRATIAGSDPRHSWLVTLLNETHRLVEAAVTLGQEGRRVDTLAAGVETVADAIAADAPVTDVLPRTVPDTPGAHLLIEALESATDAVHGAVPTATLPRQSGRQWLREYLAEVRHGRLVRLFALRLMLCMGVAAVVSEVLELQRSYWVMVTVVVVLKPDFGSVFARALQRGIGTVVGAGIGAGILALLPYGPLLLVPVIVLAFLLPYAISRNWGMFATLLTPLVLIVIDLPTRTGWQLAGIRLIDTLLGCGIVLLLGYALWPSSWHADVGRQFADAVGDIADYLRALRAEPADRAPLRRRSYRRLSDLRTAFQRAVSEPRAVSRRATAWYPAVVGLERTLDAITAAAVTAERGGPVPSETAVQRLADALRQVANAVRTNSTLRPIPLPTDPASRPVSQAITDVLELFGPTDRQHE